MVLLSRVERGRRGKPKENGPGTKERWEAAREWFLAAKESYEAILQSYETGLKIFTDVSTALSALAQARAQWIMLWITGDRTPQPGITRRCGRVSASTLWILGMNR